MPTKSSRDALERRASIAAFLRPLGWESLAKNAAAKTAPYGKPLPMVREVNQEEFVTRALLTVDTSRFSPS